MSDPNDYSIMNSDTIRDILKLAHKFPSSPRSIADTGSPEDHFDDTLNCPFEHFLRKDRLNCLAEDFLRKVLEKILIVMQHDGALTIHPMYVSQALEYFAMLDVDVEPSHEDSCNIDDDGTDDAEDSEDDDPDWTMDDAEEEDMEDYEDEDLDDHEDGYSLRSSDRNVTSGPSFDALFEPVKKITSSRDELWMLARDILQTTHHTDPVWASGAMVKLERATYAFLVEQLK